LVGLFIIIALGFLVRFIGGLLLVLPLPLWAGDGLIDSAYSLPVIQLSENQIFRGRQFLIFEERSPQPNWQEACQHAKPIPWSPDRRPDPQKAYWFKLRVANVSVSTDQWLLKFVNLFNLDFIDAYIVPEQGKPIHVKAGPHRPKSDLTWPTDRFQCEFTVAPGDSLSLFIRLQNSTGYVVDPDFDLQGAKLGRAQAHQQQLGELFMLGIFVAMALYNLALYFINRQAVYFWYVMYMLGLVAFFAYQQCYLYNYFFAEWPKIAVYANSIALEVTLVSYSLFIRHFFQLPTQFPRLNRINNGILWLAAIKSVPNFAVLYFTFNLLWSDMILINISVLQLAILFYLLVGLRKCRDLASRIVWYGMVTLFALATVQAGLDQLIINGVVNGIFNQFVYLIEFGAIIEISCFSLALGLRAKQHEIDKQKAQAEVIGLKQDQNQKLEAEVTRRTQELLESNEALKQHREEIVALNENLEDLILQRTSELTYALDDLTMKKNGLEEFSYITSHNLRGPIAQLLGLTSIFNVADPTDPFNQEVIARLRKSAQQLDEVIHDLNRVLVIGAGHELIYETLGLDELFAQMRSGLETDIALSGAHIETNFVQMDKINSVRDYLANILYHILSNAIKYRSDVRPPVIKVRSYLLGDEVCLQVTDNGLGIDLNELNKYKIFGMYQRLHTHIEGKGLGLYLAKAQAEVLRGRIDLESKLNHGTTFKIYLPDQSR
jgi:two-component system, sensor histidine kinase LadS